MPIRDLSIHLVSFADSKYSMTLGRLQAEAHRMRIFDSVLCWNEQNLDPAFLNRHSEFIKQNIRGYGYWIWKAQVVKQALNLIPQNGVLFYTDAGCSLNPKGRNRLMEYCMLIESHSSKRLAFHLPEQFREDLWTKRHTLERLGCRSPVHLSSPQILSGIFGIQKAPPNVDFIESFSQATQQYDLITDVDIVPNDPGFRSHRHDQSVWSVLNKMATPAPLVLRDETYFPNAWDNDFPFHARRWKY